MCVGYCSCIAPILLCRMGYIRKWGRSPIILSLGIGKTECRAQSRMVLKLFRMHMFFHFLPSRWTRVTEGVGMSSVRRYFKKGGGQSHDLYMSTILHTEPNKLTFTRRRRTTRASKTGVARLLRCQVLLGKVSYHQSLKVISGEDFTHSG